ncbi:MAG: hypothetical protein H0T62_12325 [Parachlamydiaceae bacterium]|nr:hypothetical protein [Parachlamydiaceae bacterium]
MDNEIESAEIKKKAFNYSRRKSEINTDAIFNDKIQEQNLELNHSVALNGQHEFVHHHPKKA